MGLVDYSDSEGSDADTPVAPAATATAKAGNPKPAFQKVIDRSNPGKITVGLPTAKTEADQNEGDVEEPPAKRRKAGGGGLGGFNDLLPAPKRAGQAKSNAAPKPRGPGLKTSSEPAFSRAPMPAYEGTTESDALPFTNNAAPPAPEEPVKLVGKSTASRFRPMSMTNNKKKPKKPVVPPTHPSALEAKVTEQTEPKPASEPPTEPAPKPKPKRSLFGAPQAEEQTPNLSIPAPTTAYEPLLSEPAPERPAPDDPFAYAPPAVQAPSQTAAPSLATTASDLNLTPSERRQLFGKSDPNSSAHRIQHFSTRDEYAANEKLRQQGEVTQHRAVKAVAPGKHSLQQLVNNAKTQQEGLEDAWAAGRTKRGEGAGRYGWG